MFTPHGANMCRKNVFIPPRENSLVRVFTRLLAGNVFILKGFLKVYTTSFSALIKNSLLSCCSDYLLAVYQWLRVTPKTYQLTANGLTVSRGSCQKRKSQFNRMLRFPAGRIWRRVPSAGLVCWASWRSCGGGSA